MGSWMTRSRAWVYIAFYDEYVGRSINTSAGISLLFFIPNYLYGLTVNRIVEQNGTNLVYYNEFFEKRLRLTHNLVMEHFELHVEKTQDLVVELTQKGPAIWKGLKHKTQERELSYDDCALIDEISGLNEFLDNFMQTHNLPETKRDRIRARMFRYSGTKDKAIAKQELYMSMFGDQR